MDLSVGSGNTESIQQMVESVETVEVVSGTERTSTGQENGSKIEASSQLSVPSSGMIEIDPHTLTYTLVEMANQQLAQQGNTMLSSSLTPSSLTTSVMSASDASPLVAAGMKRSAATLNESLGGEFSPDEVPRKKSRNYLDSHKNIEKKRRDRINTGLALLKDLVPDCRQYGSKKLDKAEIIEFTIQYVKRLQAQAQKRTAGDIDISGSQREWSNEIMTWVFQNKLLYSGPNALEQFCNALLLNLQSYGNPTTSSLGSPTSNLLLNQAQAAGQSSSSSDDESFKASLAQQLVSCFSNQGGGGTDSTTGKLENTPNQQQIAQIQALLLLQQQQLLGQQQNPEGGGATNGTQQDDNQAQQLQQLQQLQTFLLQHFASESGHQKQPSNEDNAVYTEDSEAGSSTLANNGPSLLVGSNMSANATTISSSINLPSTIVSGEGNRTDIAQSPIYTSTAALEDTLLDSAENGQTSTQMWSGQEQDSSILLEGSVPHDAIEGTVVEEEVDVELLSNAQQKMADS